MNKQEIKTKTIQYYTYGENSVPCRIINLFYKQGNKTIMLKVEDLKKNVVYKNTYKKIKIEKETDVNKIIHNIQENVYCERVRGHGNDNEFYKDLRKFFDSLIRLFWENSSKTVFLNKETKSLIINDLNTSIKIKKMGYLYCIHHYGYLGDFVPELFFTEENASEYIDEYIQENYKIDFDEK